MNAPSWKTAANNETESERRLELEEPNTSAAPSVRP
jgi:hypothetical protein